MLHFPIEIIYIGVERDIFLYLLINTELPWEKESFVELFN